MRHASMGKMHGLLEAAAIKMTSPTLPCQFVRNEKIVLSQHPPGNFNMRIRNYLVNTVGPSSFSDKVLLQGRVNRNLPTECRAAKPSPTLYDRN